jgi:hypothetical protein
MSNHTHWIGPAVGWAMLASGLTGSANVLLSYAIDSYPSRAGHMGALVNVVKNVFGFGISFKSMDWYFASGPAKQFGAMTGMLWAVYLFVVPLYFFGGKLRVWTWSKMKDLGLM